MAELIKQLSREVFKGLGDTSREVFELLSPAVDVVEDGADLLILADIPGFKKSDITLRVADSVLTLAAEREPLEYSGAAYWLQRPLKVSRRIPLPIKVEEDTEVAAKYENGVLQVRVPLKGVARVKID